MENRYTVKVSMYEKNRGWDSDLEGKHRSFFIYDELTNTIIAKFPCRDVVSSHRDDPLCHNDPQLQSLRANKLCDYMNKVEEKLLDISITEQV